MSNIPDYCIGRDAQHKLLEVSNNLNLTQIGGINILSGNGETNIGLNLGAFIDFVPDNSYHIYIEPKFVFNDETF